MDLYCNTDIQETTVKFGQQLSNHRKYVPVFISSIAALSHWLHSSMSEGD
jgi:hypothetical protein